MRVPIDALVVRKHALTRDFVRCVAQIKDFGIQNDDLDYMGISHPLHRRVLKIAASSEYSEVLLTGIQEWQEIGSVVVYKVVSRWRFSRSCVLLRYGDFKKLHRYDSGS
jgi:hypothetical protein